MLLSQALAQSLSQSSMRTEKPQTDGDSRNSEARGHFMRRILQYIPEKANLAQIWRETGNRARDQRTQFAPGITLLGIVRARRQTRPKRFFRRDGRLFQGDVLPLPPLADQIDGSIGRDARNPGVEVVLALVLLPGELVQVGKRFEQGLLSGVLRVGRIAGHPERTTI